VPQHQLTVKDVVIILIVFSLWIYSLHLVYRLGDSRLLDDIFLKARRRTSRVSKRRRMVLEVVEMKRRNPCLI
jgi:hypothetical protein